MIRLIQNKTEWDGILQEADNYDFYHTYAYHHLSKKQDEEPLLIHYTEKDKSITLPLLMRSIDNTPFNDATSVYGYPGPIIKNISSNYNFQPFQNELYQFFKELNIISVFSRLNPFLPLQDNCLSKMGCSETTGKIVYIDLTKKLEEQRADYHKRLKTYINKSRNIYSIKNAAEEADFESFMDIYHENMKRVNAKEEYFFNKKYFSDLFNTTDFGTETLLAIHNESGEVAGGAIFSKMNNIVQYHLSGAKCKYLNLNPVKLLIDEMRIRATKENYQYFNLGGGLGSNEDTLYHFKSGFSKDSKSFKVWKYMVDHNIYENLVQKRINHELRNGKENYFPLYRYQR